MWERVKLDRHKIMKNYFISSPGRIPLMCSSQKLFTFFEEHIWETASGVSLGDCFWKNVEIAKKKWRTFLNVPETVPQQCSSKKIFVLFEGHYWGHASEVSQDRIYCAQRSFVFIIKSKK